MKLTTTLTALVALTAPLLTGCATQDLEIPATEIKAIEVSYRTYADQPAHTFTIDCSDPTASDYPGDGAKVCDWLSGYYYEIETYEAPVACVPQEGGPELTDIRLAIAGRASVQHSLKRESACDIQEWGMWITLIAPISDVYLTDITDMEGHPGYTGEEE